MHTTSIILLLIVVAVVVFFYIFYAYSNKKMNAKLGTKVNLFNTDSFAAEHAANIIANINLIIGIIAFIVLLITGLSSESLILVGIGFFVLLTGLFTWSLLKIFINISYRLTNMDNRKTV